MSNNGLEAMTLLYSYDNSLPKKLLFVPKLAISYSATRMGRCQPTLDNVPGRYFFILISGSYIFTFKEFLMLSTALGIMKDGKIEMLERIA